MLLTLRTQLRNSLGCFLCFFLLSHCQADEPLWFDEFDGPTLDYSKWEIEVNAFGGGNQELQLFTDRAKNIRVESGKLLIEAHRDNAAIAGTVREFSSARIRSKRRGDWKYGRFDIRAKLPKGQGIWPAIWMLPSDEKYGGWAASGEKPECFNRVSAKTGSRFCKGFSLIGAYCRLSLSESAICFRTFAERKATLFLTNPLSLL